MFRRRKQKQAQEFYRELPSDHQLDGRVFFETIRRPEELQMTHEEPVLDLRPEGAKEPKRVSHFQEGEYGGGEIFYESVDGAPTAYVLPQREPKRPMAAEVVAVTAVLALAVVLGAAILLSFLR